jgi:hypothetical protein
MKMLGPFVWVADPDTFVLLVHGFAALASREPMKAKFEEELR